MSGPICICISDIQRTCRASALFVLDKYHKEVVMTRSYRSCPPENQIKETLLQEYENISVASITLHQSCRLSMICCQIPPLVDATFSTIANVKILDFPFSGTFEDIARSEIDLPPLSATELSNS